MTSSRAVGMLSVVLAACVAAPATLAIAAERSYETIRDVVYVERDGEPLHADIYRPKGEGPFPGVLCVHGGAWLAGNKSNMADIAQRLAEAGYTAVAIGYRLAPEHKFPAQIEDCRAALAWIRENAKQYKIDPDRLAAWGYSAGGHLVALLGVSGEGLKAVVAGGAPCDLRAMPPDNILLTFWLGGTRRRLPDVYESASPATMISADDPPMFFYHGQTDAVVAVEQATEMVAALKRAGVTAEVFTIPDTGHLLAFRNRSAQQKAVEFLDKHVKADRPSVPADSTDAPTSSPAP